MPPRYNTCTVTGSPLVGGFEEIPLLLAIALLFAVPAVLVEPMLNPSLAAAAAIAASASASLSTLDDDVSHGLAGRRGLGLGPGAALLALLLEAASPNGTLLPPGRDKSEGKLRLPIGEKPEARLAVVEVKAEVVLPARRMGVVASVEEASVVGVLSAKSATLKHEMRY